MSAAPITILVVAPNWLGDAVMALPAIADVRRRFPDAQLLVAARPIVADLFALVPGIDDSVVLAWKGHWWNRTAFHTDAVRLASVGADVAILLPNSFATAWLLKQAEIPERWGYATDMRSRLLSRAVPRPMRSMHQGAYYQHLTSTLEIPAGPLQPTLIVPQHATEAARRLLVERGWDAGHPLAALAPGAAYGTAKRWIPQHVATLATELVRRLGATCVLVGSGADRATTATVRDRVAADARSRVIDVAGETALEALAGVFSLAQVCVSNDSGAMHVAAAVGTPVAALFGPTREYETAPLARAGARTEVLTHQVWCRPCMLRECPIDHRCMTRISPERVYTAVDTLIAGVAR
ncbi:MAG TPA: lipopolysaccharide heptosyltransferase II [Vicinamibacterales bacterium]